MNTVFFLMFLTCLICIPVFILISLIKLLQKKSAKKHLKLAGISTLALIASFIGFGFTIDETPKEEATHAVASFDNTDPASAPEAISAPAFTVAPTPLTVVVTPTPTPEATPSPTPAPTPEPTPSPTPAPTPEPTPSPTPAPTPEPTPSPTPAPTPEPTPSPAVNSTGGSTLVWVDDTAKRYHRKNGCGMDNAYQVTLDEAIAMGKTPCKRCYR